MKNARPNKTLKKQFRDTLRREKRVKSAWQPISSSLRGDLSEWFFWTCRRLAKKLSNVDKGAKDLQKVPSSAELDLHQLARSELMVLYSVGVIRRLFVFIRWRVEFKWKRLVLWRSPWRRNVVGILLTRNILNARYKPIWFKLTVVRF